MGGADENLIRARSGEPRVTQRSRGNVGNEEPGAVQSTRISRKSRSGAKPEQSSREGGIFCAGWGARRGAWSLVPGALGLIARWAGLTEQGAARSSGCGDFRWPGASQGFISVLLFCASSAGARDQPAAQTGAAVHAKAGSVGAREGTVLAARSPFAALPCPLPGGIHAGWKCGVAFRPPAPVRPT